MRPPRIRTTTFALAALLATAVRADAWQVHLDGTAGLADAGYSIIDDGNGHVISAGYLGSAFAVAMNDAATGDEVWRYVEPGFGQAWDLVRLPGGDVVAVGSIDGYPNIPRDVFAVRLAGATGAVQWRRTIPSGIEGGESTAYDVALDSHGDPVLAGAIALPPFARTDGLVAKLAAADGAVVWQRNVNGAANASDVFVSLAIGPGDAVYATGQLRSLTFKGEMAVVKLSADGDELWRTPVPGPLEADDYGAGIVVTPGGLVLATGPVENVSTERDWACVRLDPSTGAIVWREDVDGGAPSAIDLPLRATAEGEDLLVSGFFDSRMGVVRLAGATGDEQWRRILAGTIGTGQSVGVAADGAGGLYVTGFADDATHHFTLAKLDIATGDELWRGGATEGRLIDVVVVGGEPIAVGETGYGGGDWKLLRADATTGTTEWTHLFATIGGGTNDFANAVAYDASGDVVVAAEIDQAEPQSRFAVMKRRGADGTLLWRRDIAGAPGTWGAKDVRIDPAGQVVAAGSLGAPNGETRASAMRLDAATGATLWATTSSGPYETFGRLAFDPAGDVLLAGGTATLATFGDILVAKLDGATGAELWRTVLDGVGDSDFPDDLASDPSGAVYVTGAFGLGHLTSSDTAFAVVKLDGTTGAELWRYTITPAAPGFGRAQFVAVGADGAVFASGFLPTADGSSAVIVRLDPATGAELWRHDVDGVSGGYDIGGPVRVDPAGRLLLGALVATSATTGDMALLRLDPTSGGELWRTPVGAGRYPSGVELGPFGTLVTAFSSIDTALSIAAVDATTGTFRWRHDVPIELASPSSYFSPIDLAVDGRGNLAVAGYRIDGDYDASILAVDGASGGEPLVCAAGSSVPASAHVNLRGLATAAADDGLRLRTRLAWTAPLDPVATGMRVHVDGATGALLDLTIPPGGYDAVAREGWRANAAGTRWSWVTAAPDAAIRKVALARDAARGLLRITIRGRGGLFTSSAAILPLRVTLQLPPSGPCIDVGLGGVGGLSCAFAQDGDRLRCR